LPPPVPLSDQKENSNLGDEQEDRECMSKSLIKTVRKCITTGI
jgi:hypothetical protein